MPMLKLYHLAFICAVFCGFAFLNFHRLYQYAATRARHHDFARSHGCKAPAGYPQKGLLFGLDMTWDAVQAFKSKTFLDRVRRTYQRNGNTFTSHSFNRRFIHTIEPDNFKAVLSTNFRHFGISAARRAAFLPLLGHSILLAEGTQWESSRALLRPCFVRSQIGDLALFRRHVENLIAALSRGGPTVDLKPLFFALTADITTEFLFGESTESLLQPISTSDEFLEAVHNASLGCEERWRRGKLADFLPHSGFRESVRTVHSFINEYVEKALQYSKSHSQGRDPVQSSNPKIGNYVLLRELGAITDNRDVLRGELLTLFFAGRDTTASLLSNLFFELAKRPHIWHRIRAEVSKEMKGMEPSYDQLSRLHYTRHCLNECKYTTPSYRDVSFLDVLTQRSIPALRLHSPLPHNARIAIQDTLLPMGGGEDGGSPVFVPAGTTVILDVAALHRREDIWGSDSREFRPSRWENDKASSWVSDPL